MGVLDVCDEFVDGYRVKEWIYTLTKQCGYTPLHALSVVMGLASIGCWLVAQMPQILMNLRRRSADSLSGVFLSIWLAGDLTNLVGCLLDNQLPTQTYEAVYFVMIDVVLASQWIYFERYLRPRLRLPREAKHRSGAAEPLLDEDVLYPIAGLEDGSVGNGGSSGARAAATGIVSVVTIVSVASAFGYGAASVHASMMDAMSSPSPSSQAVASSLSSLAASSSPAVRSSSAQAGLVIGWMSAALYLGSRLPQILKNYQRKSTDGLSLALFVCAVMGNVTYAGSVFLWSLEPSYLMAHLPWLIGSVGTLCFDFTIFVQFVLFGDGPTSVTT